ncbi:hypothetical protein ES703_65079 [subsurface metagenome]
MKFVPLFSRAVTILAVIALTVSLFTFTSCSSFNEPQETISSPISNDNYDTGKHRAFTDSWTDAGFIHNRAMDILNDSLATFDSTRFVGENSWKEWVLDVVGGFLIDSLDFDPDSLQECMEAGLESEPTQSYFDGCVDDLIEDKLISSQESLFLYRLSEIAYSSMSEKAFFDSLDAIKIDVNNILWGSSEILCEIIVEIGWYSFNYKNLTSEPWDLFPFEPPDMPGECGWDWKRFGKADLSGGIGGAVGGGIFGGLAGAGMGGAGGAAGASAADAVGQLTGWW